MDELILITHKFLNQTISDNELERLEVLVKNSAENEKVFKELIQDEHLSISMRNKIEQSKIKAIFKKVENAKNSKPVIAMEKWYKYAAIFILLLGTAAFFSTLILDRWDSSPSNTLVEQTIILELHDGTKKVIDPTDSKKVIKDQNNVIIGLLANDLLEYDNNATANTLAYNTIKIPYGKNLKVKLSDKTIVHLNAGSSLRYPVAFSEKGKRLVLLEGEGFFEVAKDASRPFIVSTQDMEIEALGTSFNVLSYSEDEEVKTTLYEGSVKVSSIKKEEGSVILLPNEQSTFDKNTEILIKTTSNAEEQKGWIEGRLIFKNERFENIIKIIQRRYDVVIENRNNQLLEERFTAQFKEETIEEVLLNFKNTHEFKFNINGKKIIIE